MPPSTLDNIIPTFFVVGFFCLLIATLSFLAAHVTEQDSRLESIALNIFGMSIGIFLAILLALPAALIVHIWS